jgi:tRNA(fMet)-specific endonuclease VapC
MIADTSFLIDIMKSDKETIKEAEEIERKHNRSYLNSNF